MMNKQIRRMIDEIFADMKMTADNLALRDEMMANAQARFEDSVRAGKTEEEAFAEVAASLGDVQSLLHDMNAEKPAEDKEDKEEKTEEKLVSGLHCEPETVKDEMQATKELWGKTGGRTYKHFVQSYHADEPITPEQAHRNAVELAEHTPAWQGFEVLIATHKDRKHIHTHFIVNSVNYEDGHKLQWSSADLRDLKERCNTQSWEQGLHVPEKGKTFEGVEREETVAWKKDTYQLLKQAEQGKVKSYVQEIALAVLDCKETAASREQFIALWRCLERLGRSGPFCCHRLPMLRRLAALVRRKINPSRSMPSSIRETAAESISKKSASSRWGQAP